MKTELSTRFSEITDAQHAFMLLSKVHQKPGETLQVYAERLLALAADAFDNQQGQPVQRQLIDICNWSKEDKLKLKVFRENPVSLKTAITNATNEQNLRRRFNPHKHHQYFPYDEKMEIDHFKPAQRC